VPAPAARQHRPSASPSRSADRSSPSYSRRHEKMAGIPGLRQSPGVLCEYLADRVARFSPRLLLRQGRERPANLTRSSLCENRRRPQTEPR
jgi:hypothetical protein